MDSYKDKAGKVYRRLLDVYGEPVWRVPLEPLDELVSTILSQNTNDRNRDIAFNRLREVFPTWEEVRDAPMDEVIAAVRQAGLSHLKGPRIQQVLRQITQERGQLSLSFLREMQPEEVRAWLRHFKGVGPKTAAIVMQFSLGMHAFPVDTHVYRVTGRIGLRPEKMDFEQAHTFLATLFEPEEYGPAHLNIIRLGREICTARNPRHEICPVREWCDYYREMEAQKD